jgi:AcrR family transcriptional regulator
MNKSVFEELEVAAPLKVKRQEARTKETRDLLIRAAKAIFIRDGYEGADLNDIAELAGRTKGAIYGHFKSKEEIFLALIADHQQEYRRKIEQLLSREVNQNIAVMRQFVIDLVEDDEWALLQFEFKMFTLRHPETKERFKDLYEPWTPTREKMYERLIGPAGKSKRSVSRGMALHSIIPMLSALLLEAEFEPSLMSKDAIKKLIGGVFDYLIAQS